MSWKEERDSLIAQTMAFVQSVNGRREEAGRLDMGSATALRVLPSFPSSVNWSRAESASPLEPVKVTALPLHGKPAPAPRPIVPSEMVNEIRARIAGFRAHQERFNREREEYFSSDACTAEGLARREPAAAAARQIDAALDQPAIFSSTGSRYSRNASGFSLIGKCPRPFMMVTSQPGMLFGDRQRLLRRAGIIIFARQQEQRAAPGVDLRDAAADVAVDLVEIEIALEHAGTALHVVPQRFPALLVRRVGADQAGDDGGADFAAMHVRPVQEIQIVIGIDMRAGLQADDGAEAFGVFERQMQRDAAADRAADHDRLVEFERGHDRPGSSSCIAPR